MKRRKSSVHAVSAAGLADWLDISQRMVRILADRRHVVRIDRGQYDLQASITAYTVHLRTVADDRPVSEAAAIELTKQRALLARAMADRVGLQNREMRANLLVKVDADRRWADEMKKLRTVMGTVPARVRQIVPTLTNHDISIIARAIDDIMETI